MRSFIRLLFGESGFIAAEKILLTLLALGALLVVAKYVLLGSTSTATKVKTSLESSTVPSPSK